jgi:hypothetical protein
MATSLRTPKLNLALRLICARAEALSAQGSGDSEQVVPGLNNEGGERKQSTVTEVQEIHEGSPG